MKYKFIEGFLDGFLVGIGVGDVALAMTSSNGALAIIGILCIGTGLMLSVRDYYDSKLKDRL